MAYAAYRDPPGAVHAPRTTVFQVLDITVTSIDAYRVRRALADCDGVGLLRCEPLLHPGAAYGNAAPRVRLLLRLPMSSYLDVLHRVIECVPDGEIGHLVVWRTHLQRQGIAHGG
jgi:hypothetical protein